MQGAQKFGPSWCAHKVVDQPYHGVVHCFVYGVVNGAVHGVAHGDAHGVVHCIVYGEHEGNVVDQLCHGVV